MTIDMVTVGNPGNASDPATGSQYGSVGYVYKIGKYDVTIGQYAEFLNTAAKNDPYSLYNPSMATDLNVAGIARAGADGSYTYSVIGSPNRPITYVSWLDAARFTNWMQNGQGAGSTETGAYTLNGTMSDNTVAINPGAKFHIPRENEWYKAAYFSPVKGGAGSPGYYAYATQSDSAPGNVIGGTFNQANYFTGNGFAVTQGSSFDPTQNYLTDVGAFTGSGSYYGTFDQSGNVFQWNDLNGTGGIGVTSVGVRGGFWYSTSPFAVSSGFRDLSGPRGEVNYVGFRLAAPVPEIDPAGMGSVLALVIGGLGLLERRRLKAT